jgi:uncharacterized repeat protein (TIGR03803 family)
MNTSISRLAVPLSAVLCLFLFFFHPEAIAGSVTVIHSFQDNSDGEEPYAALTAGTDGFLYGTTYYGGNGGGYGTIFKISTSGVLTTLHSVSYSAEGGYLYNGVTMGPDGNLYGEAFEGGPNGAGTIFSLTTSGSFSLLYALSYSGSSGYYPQYTNMVTGTDGNLYGTVSEGGQQSYGTIFQLTTSGSISFIHEMSYSDGGYLYSGLCVGQDGNLYGVGNDGGDNGNGSVFQVTTTGTFTVLHSFSYSTDGGDPQAPLLAGTDGYLYGVAESGGTAGNGTVFQVAPVPGGSYTVLHTFTGVNGDGSQPNGGLLQTADGTFYGVTTDGGDSNEGTIFKMTVSGTNVTFETVHSFDNSVGTYPYGGLATGSDGYLYGTTQDGGASGDGVVYRFYPGGPEFHYLPLSGQSTSQVQFNAVVNPNGTPTTAYFEYGSNSNYGSNTPVQVLGSGSNDIVVSATLSGLNPSSTFYYQLVVTSSTYGAFDAGQQSFTTLNVPTLVQGPATNITSSSATLTGTVNPATEDTQVFFLYGLTPSYGSQSDSVWLGNSTDNTAIGIPISGLLGNTQYHFIMETTGSAGNFFGSDTTFTTGSSGFAVTGNPAQNVTSFSALLSGTVNPGGLQTYAYFQYGLTSTYTNSTAVQAIGNPTAQAAILTNLSGLQPDTTYHYCLTGSSGGLVVSSTDMTFITPPVNPGFTLNPTGGVTISGASLSGTVNPAGLDAQVYFLYGLSGTYGSQTAAVDLGNGTTALGVEATLANLLAGTKYHYEMVITNSDGIFYGGDQTFTTGTVPALTESLEALKGDAADEVPGTTFASFGPPIINANGHIAFAAMLASGTAKVTLADNSGIWADDGSGVRHLVARTSGTAAGVSGATYSGLGNPVYNDAQQIAFLATLKLAHGNSAGIFTNIGGNLTALRLVGQQADGATTGILYNAFKGLVLTDDSIVFEATLSGSGVKPTNNTGIWVTRFATGQTQLIARTGAVDGVTNKMFKTLTIFPVVPVVSGQSRSADPNAGNVAYLATFTDGTSAVIKVTAQ